jgi:hypothetical protein
MLDEIQKAQQMAIELKIHETIENVVTNAGAAPDATELQWEGCQICLENEGFFKVFSIVMSNGLCLYKGQLSLGNITITNFRYGSWVEKLKAYSEQITAEKKQIETEKSEQEQRAKLSPFSVISDDEFKSGVFKG